MAYAFSDMVTSFSATQIVAADIDVVSKVTEGCPLLTLIATQARKQVNGMYSGIGSREKFWTRGQTYFHKEYGDFVRTVQINGAKTTETTLILDDTEGLVKGSIILNKTSGEMIRVTSVTNATTITVERAFGTVSIANIADDEVLALVSQSTAFGAVGVNEVRKVATEVTNYFQKITTTFFRSDLEDFTQNELQNMSWDNVEKVTDMFVYERTIEHATQIEYALLLGQKKTSATGNQMGGVIRLAISGINGAKDISAAPTLANLTTAIKPTFKYGSSTMKYLLVGEDCDAVLQNMIELYKIQAHGIQNYSINGIDLTFVEITLGAGQKIRIVYHPYMTSVVGYGSYALVLDPSVLKLVWMKGRTYDGKDIVGTTRLEPVTSESNYANAQYDIVSYVTLQAAVANAHGFIKMG